MPPLGPSLLDLDVPRAAVPELGPPHPVLGRRRPEPGLGQLGSHGGAGAGGGTDDWDAGLPVAAFLRDPAGDVGGQHVDGSAADGAGGSVPNLGGRDPGGEAVCSADVLAGVDYGAVFAFAAGRWDVLDSQVVCADDALD